MAADFSRRIFDPRKHYSGVLMQEGRVQLDADWNEQLDIGRYRTQTETQDVIGPSGAPLNGGGFAIGIVTGGADLTISAGRFYAEGLLCELEQPITYTRQPDFPDPTFTVSVTSPPLSPPTSPPTFGRRLALA